MALGMTLRKGMTTKMTDRVVVNREDSVHSVLHKLADIVNGILDKIEGTDSGKHSAESVDATVPENNSDNPQTVTNT
jgi:division protein CdvB (Snf7/Vps24/ESCRT-III family)